MPMFSPTFLGNLSMSKFWLALLSSISFPLSRDFGEKKLGNLVSILV